MPEKTAAEKLRLKPGMSAALMNPPEGVLPSLCMPEGVRMVDDPAGADFVLVFASTQAEAEARVTALSPAITDKTVAWIGYPKGSRSAGHDLNRDTIASFVRTVGLVVNANFSIDEKWSALRVRPLKAGE
jgi:hypothetical protein